MSKKGKGVVFDSTPNCGVGSYEDAKARLRHQNLLQDYEELQRETDAMRSKLEAANRRKSILAAEVRFLRKRYKLLVKSKNLDSSREQACMEMKTPPKRAKTQKKKQYLVERAVLSNAFPATIDQSRKKISHNGKQSTKRSSAQVSNSSEKEKKRTKKEAAAPNMALLYEKNQKETTSLRNPTTTFDLNEDCCPNGKEACFPSRAPIFDLNEISTGDEDLATNVEAIRFEEAKKSLIRGINEEQQNDLKLAVCRNSGEGSSRVGKRKISWQDPVALRV